MFSGDGERVHVNKWVNNAASYVLLTLREIVFVLDISLGNLRNFTPPDSKD